MIIFKNNVLNTDKNNFFRFVKCKFYLIRIHIFYKLIELQPFLAKNNGKRKIANRTEHRRETFVSV